MEKELEERRERKRRESESFEAVIFATFENGGSY